MTGRLTALLAVIGALGIAFTGIGAGAPVVQAIGWASAAGVGLASMLRGPGLRALGVFSVPLSVAAAASAVVAGGWAWFAVGFAAVLAVAGVATFMWGPLWRAQSASSRSEPAKDLWKQFDAGDDPTTDAGDYTDQDPR